MPVHWGTGALRWMSHRESGLSFRHDTKEERISITIHPQIESQRLLSRVSNHSLATAINKGLRRLPCRRHDCLPDNAAAEYPGSVAGNPGIKRITIQVETL